MRNGKELIKELRACDMSKTVHLSIIGTGVSVVKGLRHESLRLLLTSKNDDSYAWSAENVVEALKNHADRRVDISNGIQTATIFHVIEEADRIVIVSTP